MNTLAVPRKQTSVQKLHGEKLESAFVAEPERRDLRPVRFGMAGLVQIVEEVCDLHPAGNRVEGEAVDVLEVLLVRFPARQSVDGVGHFVAELAPNRFQSEN